MIIPCKVNDKKMLLYLVHTLCTSISAQVNIKLNLFCIKKVYTVGRRDNIDAEQTYIGGSCLHATRSLCSHYLGNLMH